MEKLNLDPVLQLQQNHILERNLFFPILHTPLVLTGLEWSRWQLGPAGERGRP